MGGKFTKRGDVDIPDYPHEHRKVAYRSEKFEPTEARSTMLTLEIFFNWDGDQDSAFLALPPHVSSRTK